MHSPLAVSSASFGVSSPSRAAFRTPLRWTATEPFAMGLLSLVDTPECWMRVLEFCALPCIGRLLSSCKLLASLLDDDEVWKVCWGRPWVHGYLSDVGARDAKEWYGGYKAALQAETAYHRAPHAVDFSVLLHDITDSGAARAAPSPDADAIAQGTDVLSPTLRSMPSPTDDSVSCFLSLSDPAIVLGMSSGEVRLISATTVSSYMLQHGSIRHMIRRGRMLFTASWHGAVHIINLDTLMCSLLLMDLPSPVFGLQFWSNLLFLCSGNGSMYVYTLTVVTAKGVSAFNPADGVGSLDITATKLQELSGHAGAVTDFHLHKGALASCSMDKSVRLWQRDVQAATADARLVVSEFKCVQTLWGHNGPIWTVQVRCPLPDGDLTDIVRIHSGVLCACVASRLLGTTCSPGHRMARCACGAACRASARRCCACAPASKCGV